jgi:hypothetical protein
MLTNFVPKIRSINGVVLHFPFDSDKLSIFY